MSIKSELSVLKVNIQNAKNKLYTNLVDKGVTDITTASTLDAMADSVSGITTGTTSGSGGNPFDVIGYTALPQYIQDGINYTVNKCYDSQGNIIKKNFRNDRDIIYAPKFDTSNITDMKSMFANCISLKYVPEYDTSKVTDMYGMFSSCAKLESVITSNWNTSNVTNMSGLFSDCNTIKMLDLRSFDTSNVTEMGSTFNSCVSLISLDLSSWNTSKVITMNYMFQKCENLETLDISNFDTSNSSGFTNFFYYCYKLKKVDGYISLKSDNSTTNQFNYHNGDVALRKFAIKDLGHNENNQQLQMSYAKVWGVDSDDVPDARQSLVDSLLTYSFDRKSAGYNVMNIRLSTDTKAVLTESEIAQITAKGYTIA